MLKVQECSTSGGGSPQLHAVVKGIMSGMRVEFDFIYGDADLSVELVLPIDAFREFCSENDCLISAEAEGLRASLKRLVGLVAVVPASPTA